MKHKVSLIILFVLFCLPLTVFAIEVAPRISDREIIEKLATLEAGQAALRSEMKAGQVALRTELKAGHDALNKRIDDMRSTMLALFMALISLMVSLFAYIAWDRRTMTKPIVDRLDHLEKEFIRDLEIDNNDGSKLTRLIQAMRTLAKQDEKLASVLRNFSLL